MTQRADECVRRQTELAEELRSLGCAVTASATSNSVYAVPPEAGSRRDVSGVRVWLPHPAVSADYSWRTAGRRHHHAPGDLPAGEVAERILASLATSPAGETS